MSKCQPENVLRAYVAGQAKLGYAVFDPGPDASDIILAAFPKSGSTWTSYLMQQIRSGGDDSFGDIKDEVIDITPGHWDPAVNPFRMEQRRLPRTFKTHGSYRHCPKGARYIYVARDPKDSFWSLYHFVHDLFALEERMPIEEFFTGYYVERFGTGHDVGNVWDHFIGWFPHRDDANVLWLHYEDMLEDRAACIKKMASFMGVELSGDVLKVVIEHSEINHMRAIASRINPSPENRVGRVVQGFGPELRGYAREMKFGKMRKGIVGDGLSGLPEKLRAALDDEWTKRITPVLGYKSYDEMRAARAVSGLRPPAGQPLRRPGTGSEREL